MINPLQAYGETKAIVDTDDKPKILLKTYQIIIEKLDIVKMAIHKREYELKFTELSKITAALHFLNNSLDMSYGEIPKNLSNLYDYLIRRLQEVHQSMDVEIVDECKRILTTLFESFSTAHKTSKQSEKIQQAPLGRRTV